MMDRRLDVSHMSDEVDRTYAMEVRPPPDAAADPRGTVEALVGKETDTWYVLAKRRRAWLKSADGGAHRGWWVAVARPAAKQLDCFPVGDADSVAAVAPHVAACVAAVCALAGDVPGDVRVCPGAGGALRASSAKALAAALRARLPLDVAAVKCQDGDDDAPGSASRLVLHRDVECVLWQALANVLDYRMENMDAGLPGRSRAASLRPSLPESRPELSTSDVRRLFDAARTLRAAAPWDTLTTMEPLLVTLPRRSQPKCVLVAGRGDAHARGLFVYESFEDLCRARGADVCTCDALQYQSVAEAPFGTLDDVAELELPVDGGAVPLVFRKTGPLLPDPSESDLRAMWANAPPAAALRDLALVAYAIAKFATSCLKRDGASVALPRAPVRVALKTGDACTVEVRPAGDDAVAKRGTYDGPGAVGFEDRCARCAAPPSAGAKLLRCGRCRSVYYCGRACQTSDFKAHKGACADLAAERAKAAADRAAAAAAAAEEPPEPAPAEPEPAPEAPGLVGRVAGRVGRWFRRGDA